ncbi:MAG: hypothetical protein JWO16_1569 [Sphingomonas bacterium]|nr:hypothetical protein [Sphingomonas bacterium]
MSHKTSPARVEAFFRALGETGNRTIAAERARVSQSWVTLHRATDPDFAARMVAALAEAKASFDKLRTNGGSLKPAAGWGSIDGEELVVRGTRGRRTQIARARLKQWTPRTEARFLAALAACCNVKAACRAVGMSQAAAYNHYARWPDFEKRWEAALEEGFERLELALFDHAGRAFAAVDYPPDMAMPPVTFDQAIQLLGLHQSRVHKIGKRPGRKRHYARTSEEVFESLAHKLDRVEKNIRAGGASDPVAARRELDRGARIVRGG